MLRGALLRQAAPASDVSLDAALAFT